MKRKGVFHSDYVEHTLDIYFTFHIPNTLHIKYRWPKSHEGVYNCNYFLFYN